MGVDCAIQGLLMMGYSPVVDTILYYTAIRKLTSNKKLIGGKKIAVESSTRCRGKIWLQAIVKMDG